MSMYDYKKIIETRIKNLESLEEKYELLNQKTQQKYYKKQMDVQEEIGVLQEILNGVSDIHQWEECYKSDEWESKGE